MFTGTLLTMFISTIALLLGMFVDGIVIGHYMTTNDMAAYGVITPISSILLAVSGVFSSGSQLAATEYLAVGKTKEARSVFTFAGTLLFLIGSGLMVLFMIFSEQFSGTLGAWGSLSKPGQDYFFGLSFSTPFLLLATYMVPFLQLDGNKKTAVVAVAMLTLTDIVGDLLCAAVFNLGMFGIGLTTSISAGVAFLIMCTNFFRRSAVFKPSFRGLKIRKALTSLIMGIPTAASRFYATFRVICLNYLLLSISTSAALAAFSARTNLGMVCASLAMAIGMATLTVTGVLYSEEDRSMLSRLFKTGIFYSLIINTLIMIALLVFADFIISIYMQADPETCALAARALRFCAVSLPFYSVNNMLTNYLQASHRLKYANILMFLQSFLFSVLFALAFCNILGTDAVWASYIVCEILTSIIYVLAAWKKKKAITFNSMDLLMLPDDYGGSPENKMEGFLKSINDVYDASSRAYDFCISHNTGEEKASAISLSLRELGTNVIKFGFSDGVKHSFEYRILIKDDSIIFRLRDDCQMFDPVNNLNIANKEKESHKGTKALFDMAKKVSYMNTMALNNLLIVV